MKKQYDFISSYHYCGTYKVSLNGKWGVIDKNNKIIIPLEYDAIDYITDYIIAKKDELWGLFDISGKQLLAPEYDDIEISRCSNLLRIVKNSFYALFNLTTGKITDFKYISIRVFDDKTILVKTQDGYGIIDSSFKEIAPCKYEVLKEIYLQGIFHEPVLFAIQNSKSYIINYNNVILKTVEYEDIKPLHLKEVLAVKQNGLWGLIDYNFNYIVSPRYYDISYSIGKSFIEFSIDAYHRGVMNLKGEIILPPIYKSIRTSDEHFIVRKDMLYGILDFEGKQITDFIFDDISTLTNYYETYVDSKYGIVDFNGNQVIPNQYDAIHILNDGFLVYLEKCDEYLTPIRKYGICDSTGKLVSKVIYNYIESINCEAKQAVVYINDEKGIFTW